MNNRFERDDDELDVIRRKLHDDKILDLEEAQELWYRKNYLESGRAAGEFTDNYGDEE